MTDSILTIKDLSINYDGDQPILCDFSLKIKNNEFIVIVGESGCGKTSLINAIAGFIDYQGEIKKPNNISVIFQDHSIYPWLKVKDNIALGLKQKKQTQQIEEYLEKIDMTEFKHRYPFQLSGGQKQRVAIARAFISEPDLILMDEPFNSLDVLTREKMQQWILDFWQKNKTTVIFVTHDIEEAIFLANRIVSLSGKNELQEIKIPDYDIGDTKVKYSPDFIDLRQRVGAMI